MRLNSWKDAQSQVSTLFSGAGIITLVAYDAAGNVVMQKDTIQTPSLQVIDLQGDGMVKVALHIKGERQLLVKICAHSGGADTTTSGNQAASDG